MKSVDRVGALLACFSTDTPELALPELAQQMGLGKATVYRYATALHQAGLLRWDEERQVYGVGPEPLRLTSVLIRSFSVEQLSAPFMRRLGETLDLTTTLAVWFDGTPVIVACFSATSRDVRQEIALGTRLAHEHAAGLVLRTFGTPSRRKGKVAAELESVRKAGMAIVTNERDGIRAISAPVFRDDLAVGALSVLGPIPILPESTDSEHARALLATCKEITAAHERDGVVDPD
jgi:DNA-binding IclR family transcriptional regulator